MTHSGNSIQALLTTAVPVVTKNTTAYEAEQLLRTRANEFETVNYLYLVDEQKRLIGVLSLQELFHLSAHATVAPFVRPTVSVGVSAKQIEVADLALKHTIKAIPVVGQNQEFLGVVPSDKILQILSHEHTKDVLRLAGVHHAHSSAHEAVLQDSPFTHVKMRLPWLILGLFGGVAAAMVVGFFEETLADELILAAFIPAIIYMADAVGTQTEMLFVRALSVQKDLNIKSYIIRESVVNALLGLVLGSIIFVVSFVWIKSLLISSILGISIVTSVLFTTMVAIVLPWMFYIRGQDPAVASGPLATVICDISSLGIYLLVASLFLA